MPSTLCAFLRVQCDPNCTSHAQCVLYLHSIFFMSAACKTSRKWETKKENKSDLSAKTASNKPSSPKVTRTTEIRSKSETYKKDQFDFQLCSRIAPIKINVLHDRVRVDHVHETLARQSVMLKWAIFVNKSPVQPAWAQAQQTVIQAAAQRKCISHSEPEQNWAASVLKRLREQTFNMKSNAPQEWKTSKIQNGMYQQVPTLSSRPAWARARQTVI